MPPDPHRSGMYIHNYNQVERRSHETTIGLRDPVGRSRAGACHRHRPRRRRNDPSVRFADMTVLHGPGLGSFRSGRVPKLGTRYAALGVSNKRRSV